MLDHHFPGGGRMPCLVQFGAGNIGRGFIAPLFASSAWEVVFVDIDDAAITACNQRGAYTVTEVGAETRFERTVQGVRGINAADAEAVRSAVAQADLVATAVGLGALKHVGPAIGAGLAARWQQGDAPLDVLVCENGVQAVSLLAEAISDSAPADWQQRCGLVRVSVGRMIPADQRGDVLDITVEPYACLPVEADAFKGPVAEGVTGLKPVTPFQLAFEQKLYLHNGTHACLAYAGQRRGHADLATAMADADLAAGVRAAGLEICRALATEHAADAVQREQLDIACIAMLDDLLARYRNPHLGDTVARVGRDPFRKLAADDRLIGALGLCRKHDLPCHHLARFVVDALAWEPADDEPGAARWHELTTQGWRATAEAAAGLPDDDSRLAVMQVADRQRQAASRIRAAGMVLSRVEEAEIEIADFGLGRYEEIGLAIHVYVNTDRCCAKELAMEPGMMCPEHIHPDIAGGPGKEETFRVRAGICHLFVPGDGRPEAAAAYLPAGKQDSVSVYRHIELQPGEQATLAPNTKHWFVAGPAGAVVSEFSTASHDDADIFTDQDIQRVPELGPHVG